MIENKNKKIEFDYDKGGSSTERRTLFVTDVSDSLIKGIDLNRSGWRSFSTVKMSNISTAALKAEEKRIVELNLPDDHQIILK